MRYATDRQDDAALLQRMFALDPAAWREFHQRYDRLIWCCINKVATRFVNLLGPEDLQEIYANLFAELLANGMYKLRSFHAERGNKLGTWIGMLSMNASWDYLRVLSRHPAGDPLSVVEDAPAHEESPFEQVAWREDCARVAQLVSAFSRRDRTFVRLYFVDGRTPEEVAAAMGISVKTVYSKKHKIRSRLAQMLSETSFSAAA